VLSHRPRNSRPNTATWAAFGLSSILCASLIVLPALRVSASPRRSMPIFRAVADPPYPIGIQDNAEPSGYAPPSASALDGYTQSYVNDFKSSALPLGWYKFTGLPSSDPGAHFGGSHVIFKGGLLQLNTYRDAAWHNRWVTGGLCQCGLAQTYGAYFVRSRVRGAGPNEAELLWPKLSTWPPEIDFSETGGSLSNLSASLHYGAMNHIDQRFLQINMSRWHTWGVIWTPTSVSYLVDGQVWGSVTVSSEIPRAPMTLDLEQRTKCSMGEQCPTSPVSMQVDWVAEYSNAATQTYVTPTPPTTTSTTATSTTSTTTTTTTTTTSTTTTTPSH
jgi:hypothetical protein